MKNNRQNVLRNAIVSLLILRVLFIGVAVETEIQKGDFTIKDLGKAAIELIAILRDIHYLDDKQNKKNKRSNRLPGKDEPSNG